MGKPSREMRWILDASRFREAGESLKERGVLNGLDHRFRAVDPARGDDFLYVVMRIHALFFKLSVVVLRFWAEGQKAAEHFLIAGLFPLSDQLLGVVRVFEVSMPLEASRVPGDELTLMIP